MKMLPAICISIGIFTLSWFGRGIQKFFRELLGLEGLLVTVSLACLLFVVVVSKVFELRPGNIRFGLLFFPVGIWILRQNPEEVVHLIEYGAFSLAALWGMSATPSRDSSLYKVGLLSFLVGVGDELLQGINPDRFFDLRDIVINVIGSLLAIVLFRVR